jgi:hypothetical protein
MERGCISAGHRARRLAVVGTLLVILPTAGRSWSGTTTGQISGRVVDGDGTPLANVVLAVESPALGPRSVVDGTQGDGSFNVAGLPPGRYTVRCEAEGFMPQERQYVTVRGRRTTEVTIRMVVAESAGDGLVMTEEMLEIPVASTFAVRGGDSRSWRDWRSGTSEPWIHPSMPDAVRAKLDAAFQLAIRRVAEQPRCGGLFLDLGVDGVGTLLETLYFPANPFKEKERCRSSWAYTYVEAAPTRLCRKFAALSNEQAAMVLIHEALHHAGLAEAPWWRASPTAYAINLRVQKSCGIPER